MALRIPTDLTTFLECFPSWPDDSLAYRTDIEAGSRWRIRDIGTFQVFCPNRRRDFPRWLQREYLEAAKCVTRSPEIQRAIQLLGTRWGELNRAELMRRSGAFAPLFSHLAEVTEQPPTPRPDRFFRERPSVADDVGSSSQESSSSSGPPSSPLERPSKRIREHRSAESYVPPNESGGESDQSSYNQQVKPEPVTNACVYHLLQCVTESTRQVGDNSFRLEWALTQDTFHIRTPHSYLSSKNDGGLVRRGLTPSGQWKRQNNISYCSIEAKSHHDVASKPEAHRAQEAAHLVGMFAQRIANPQAGSKHPWNVIPLVAASQNNISLVLGTFPDTYEAYLTTGHQTDYSAFIELQEYGPYNLTNAEDFEKICELIIALVMHIESYDH